MREDTIAALDALNARFYEAAGASFSASRPGPWPGFHRMTAGLQRRLRVLDVGCGNGRLAQALLDAGHDLQYVGVDKSAALLEIARARFERPDGLGAEPVTPDGVPPGRDDPGGSLARPPRFEPAALPDDVPEGAFDLIAAIAVLHHIPGAARRSALVRTLADRLAPGGRLCVTVWRVDHPQLAKLVVPWRHAPSVDPSDLEPGDRLLSWGARDAQAAPRWVRHAVAIDDAEVDGWVSGCGLTEDARFDSDGRSGDLNRYFLLRRPK